MNSHRTIRFTRATTDGEVVATVAGIDQPPGRIWQLQSYGQPLGNHIEHVLVLMIPGRSVWGGIGAAREYVATEFQVYVGHFIDPNAPMGLGDPEPRGVSCAIAGGCEKLPGAGDSTIYFRGDRVVDFPKQTPEWPRTMGAAAFRRKVTVKS